MCNDKLKLKVQLGKKNHNLVRVNEKRAFAEVQGAQKAGYKFSVCVYLKIFHVRKQVQILPKP